MKVHINKFIVKNYPEITADRAAQLIDALNPETDQPILDPAQPNLEQSIRSLRAAFQKRLDQPQTSPSALEQPFLASPVASVFDKSALATFQAYLQSDRTYLDPFKLIDEVGVLVYLVAEAYSKMSTTVNPDGKSSR